LAKIQTHIDVLEKSTARVSSRAEVFGAIQQVGGYLKTTVIEDNLKNKSVIVVWHLVSLTVPQYHRVHDLIHAHCWVDQNC